ncbi:hypothetical protein [Nocardia aurantiaca]|uniref:Uncharacterized protein n=1 Tax=Nocardia aurantiaca TaxID=2675850 RepID=A0A6I3L6P1_9NOCA|nr:hypothetical protein [Nocardia aurantiaca]MTE17028.1 hypothetical protein [Nocardia aurantiaca]
MPSRDIVVAVGDNDWFALSEAAESAGMTVQEYVSWGVRILAIQARPGGIKQDHTVAKPKAPRIRPGTLDGSESDAWTETFSARLSHRADLPDRA